MRWGIVKRSQLGNDWSAEAHLRAEHACTQDIGHGSACGDRAFTTRDSQWLCPAHAERRDWEAAHQS